MSSLKGKLAARAVRSTAKHTAHGTASKLKRAPARSATLVGLGAAAGLLAGWLIFRRAGAAPAGEQSLSA